MSRNDERKPERARATGGNGRPDGDGLPNAAPSHDAAAQQLEAKLRELHEKYGDQADIPEHLLDLAREVSDAYERLDGAGEEDRGKRGEEDFRKKNLRKRGSGRS